MTTYYEPLTARELDILALKLERKSNRDIATDLHLSINTVKWYVSQIYSKLDVKNRRELEQRVQELDLSKPQEISMNESDKIINPLTEREITILNLLAQGYSNKQIAKELIIAEGTVKSHVHKISQKLYTKNRTQTVLVAKQLDLIQADTSSKDNSSPHHLPKRLTPFIGRIEEVNHISKLLQDLRLLTLTGAGGTGKTRLSLEVARQIEDQYADGIIFVDLSIIRDASQVAGSIASALGLVENRGESLENTIQRVLAPRSCLLILDNFEHVLDSAPLVADILQATSYLKIIVTSREPLQVYGEYEYHVPTLALLEQHSSTSFEALMENEAIQLFCQRTKAINHRFEPSPDNIKDIAQICIKLDGLPLAIELAAARGKLLTPKSLLARLTDRLDILATTTVDIPKRQKTIRDAISWSYDLLNADEKQLFMRLSIFQGGSSLEACETICSGDLEIDVIDGLTSLINKSLVIQQENRLGEPRFRMLETIHEFAAEQLLVSGDVEQWKLSHATYFKQLAEDIAPKLRHSDQQYWFEYLEIELENMRTVLRYTLLGTGDPNVGVSVFNALMDMWWYGSHYKEADYWGRIAIEHIADISQLNKGKLFFIVGYFHWRLRYNYDITFDYTQKAYNIGLQLENKWLMAMALRYMGGSHLVRPQHEITEDIVEQAIGYVTQSIQLFKELEDLGQLAHSLNALGQLYTLGKDHHKAAETYRECIQVAQKAGDTRRIVMNMMNLGGVERDLGHVDASLAVVREALHIIQSVNTQFAVEELIIRVTPIDEPYKFVRLLAVSNRIVQNSGIVRHPNSDKHVQDSIQLMKNLLDNQSFMEAWQEGFSLSTKRAIMYALDQIDPFAPQHHPQV